jgi:thiol-disulfide isomerase/thioredoxin
MKKMSLVLLVAGLTLAFFSPPWAVAGTPGECPSCEPFGMQRFTNKTEAPAFTLKSMDGTQVALNQLRGKPLFLFFWGTWCGSCKDDMVLIKQFIEGKKDLISFYTVVVDGEREKKARNIMEKLKLNLPTLLIYKEKVIDTYEIRMIPTVYLIDQEGFLAGRSVGPRDWSKPLAWSAVQEVLNIH